MPRRKRNRKIDGTNTELGALYLNTTKYWDDGTEFAYRIGSGVDINVTTSGAFDEFVAYTAASADSITKMVKTGLFLLRPRRVKQIIGLV